MTEPEFLEILERYLAGTCSPAEKAAVEQWLLRRGNTVGSFADAQDERERKDKIWSRVHQATEQKALPVRQLRSVRVQWAAAAVLLLGVAALAWVYGTKENNPSNNPPVAVAEQVWQEYTNPSPKIRTIRLADGSHVWLRPNSTLRLRQPFGFAQNRELHLVGEAFFKVARDTSRPFLVHTGKLLTRVLGTSFNIRAYAAEERVEVNVESGKVAVYEQGIHPKQLQLTPNQGASYDKSKGKLVKRLVMVPVTVPPQPAAEELVFKNEPFGRVLHTLGETYNVSISTENTALQDCPITASFAQQSLYFQLDLLCKSVGATYEIRGAQIVVRGGNCAD
ncbi:MAG: FecR domain-containing protein [Cytophagales bacterium]|nr:FecR domain-containing protein [Cytophagales bacterium]